MTTIRIKHEGKYFVAANQPFNDKRLSWEARGLMGYLLSKPDDWQIRVHDLREQGSTGRQKVQRMLAELEAAGYLRREFVRLERGRFDWMSTIYETPGVNPNAESEQAHTVKRSKKRRSTIDGKTVHGAAVDGAPVDGKVLHIVSTESTSTESTSTETKNTHAATAVVSENVQESHERAPVDDLGEIKQAFAENTPLQDIPARDDTRYPKWQKGYKELAEVRARTGISAERLAVWCAGEAARMGTLISWPGAYVNIAEGVVAMLRDKERETEVRAKSREFSAEEKIANFVSG